MALSKTWYTDMNCASPDVGATSPEGMLWLLKSMLIGGTTGTNGATGAPPGGALLSVVGSSDAVTAAMDATDRWLGTYNATKIVFSAAGSMSWIVAGNANYQVLIGCKHALHSAFDLRFSKAGFTGGSLTAYPTATDQWAIDNQAFHDATSTAWNGHIARDDDGYFVAAYGKVSTNFYWGALGNCILEDTDGADAVPMASFFEYQATTPGAGTILSTVMAARNVGNTTSFSGSGSCEPFAMATTQSTNPNSSAVSAALLASGLVAEFPIYVWLPGASPKQIKGRFPDIFQTFRQKVPGSFTPATGNKESNQLAHITLPFGVVPTL